MLDQATLPDSRNAISSPASGFGLTRCDVQDGATAALFGRALAPANLSARQARGMGLLTSGIYGRRGFTSLRSANLASSLGSKLSAQFPKAGSTLFTMTWKHAATPSGRSVFRLVASGRNTAATGFGSWPTPTKTQAGGQSGTVHGTETAVVRGEESESDRLGFGSTLLLCGNDGLFRKVPESCFPLLVDGSSNVLAQNGAYGNAINAEAAEAVIRAYMECRP